MSDQKASAPLRNREAIRPVYGMHQRQLVLYFTGSSLRTFGNWDMCLLLMSVLRVRELVVTATVGIRRRMMGPISAHEKLRSSVES